jgi:hypothetical protein
MLTEGEVTIWMLIITPIILVIVVTGFVVFVRWGKRDAERNRIRED